MTVIGGSGSSYGHIEDVDDARWVASYRERSQSIANAVSASLKRPNEAHFPIDILISYISAASMRGYSRATILDAVYKALYDDARGRE